jgi:hypothetical protein
MKTIKFFFTGSIITAFFTGCDFRMAPEFNGNWAQWKMMQEHHNDTLPQNGPSGFSNSKELPQKNQK